MSPGQAALKASLFEQARGRLISPEWAWFVPGRIELMGKHTDYAGGRSLLCATEQGFCFLAAGRADHRFRVLDASSGAEATFSLEASVPEQVSGWAAYPAAVARRLQRDFGIGCGAEVVFASDLPPAAGLSSSAALCIGCFLVLRQANRLDALPASLAVLPDLLRLADYVGAVESGRPFGPFPGDSGVGTLGGSQDQTAILCAVPDALVQFSFVPVRFERRIPFPERHILAVGSSGVAAEKAGGARASYNAASQAVVEIVRRFEATGRTVRSLAAVLETGPRAREELVALVAGDAALERRLTQFLVESEELIPAAGDALLGGDLPAFGRLVDRSHAGAHPGLANQIPETHHLAESARGLGAVAASAFGAGFGGSVWAMVALDGAGKFLDAWRGEYLRRFPEREQASRFMLTRAGPAAVTL